MEVGVNLVVGLSGVVVLEWKCRREFMFVQVGKVKGCG